MSNTETLRRWAVAFALMGMGVCLVLIILAGEAHAGAIDTGEDFEPSPLLVKFIAFTLVMGVALGWLAGMRDLYVSWLQRRRLRP